MLLAPVCDSGKVDPTRERLLPPKLSILQSWSTLFRCEGTFSNYLGHVKTACMLCGVPVKVCSASVMLRGTLLE